MDYLDQRITISRVIINREPSNYFPHKRGLRQGDPLSPLLFNLAVDVFQQMVNRVSMALNRAITSKIKEAITALQYADDTTVLASSNKDTLISLKITIRLFAAISGLHVNYHKSNFIPLNIEPDDLPWIQAILGYERSSFPIQYLGLPLTIQRPTRELYLPLIEKVEKKLGGWQGRLLSRAGRLQMVQSVLSAVPVYYMLCFRLPMWVVNRIDRIRRNFLWGRGENNPGISITNWQITCIPKEWGGLGISDLCLF